MHQPRPGPEPRGVELLPRVGGWVVGWEGEEKDLGKPHSLHPRSTSSQEHAEGRPAGRRQAPSPDVVCHAPQLAREGLAACRRPCFPRGVGLGLIQRL